ncbi:DUF4249 domain-containing protein [Parabacteroides sp. OttesenSCG-928-K15]|nr:DUF4249 domain-containing protein [Parabacteroides sp. OttesenSCG-928-K15]
MQQSTFKYSYLFLFSFLFASCENYIEFKGEDKETKLVINHVIDTSKDTQYLDLSASYFLFGDNDYDWWDPSSSVQPGGWDGQWPGGDIGNLPIEVTVNGESQALSLGSSQLEYKAALQAGDKIAIDVDHEWTGRVHVEETVPEVPVILSVDTLRFYDAERECLFMRSLITIKDNPRERNFYRLIIRKKTLYSEGTQWEYLDETTHYYIDQDPALNSLADQTSEDEDENVCRIFSDNIFDGKEYTINVYFLLGFNAKELKEKVSFDIELYAITESLYLYLRSLEQSWKSDVFSQPVRIYSNVKGGYGILGIQNPTILSYDVK